MRVERKPLASLAEMPRPGLTLGSRWTKRRPNDNPGLAARDWPTATKPEPSLSHRCSMSECKWHQRLRQSGDNRILTTRSCCGLLPRTNSRLSSAKHICRSHRLNPAMRPAVLTRITGRQAYTETPMAGFDLNTYRMATGSNTLELNSAQTLGTRRDFGSRTAETARRVNRKQPASPSSHSPKHRFNAQFSTELGVRRKADRNQQFAAENTWNAAGT